MLRLERLAEHRIVHVAGRAARSDRHRGCRTARRPTRTRCRRPSRSTPSGPPPRCGVESIDLVVDPVGLSTTDSCHPLTPSIALHEAWIPEHPHGDVGVLCCRCSCTRGQVRTQLVQVGDLVLRRIGRQRDEVMQRTSVSGQFSRAGTQVVAADRHRDDRAVRRRRGCRQPPPGWGCRR